jgi:hypothetical protein
MDFLSYSWLRDFDWSVRLVLSSDKLSALRQPLLMLKLDTIGPDGTVVEQVLELTLEELKTFSETLISAQKVLITFHFIMLLYKLCSMNNYPIDVSFANCFHLGDATCRHLGCAFLLCICSQNVLLTLNVNRELISCDSKFQFVNILILSIFSITT